MNPISVALIGVDFVNVKSNSESINSLVLVDMTGKVLLNRENISSFEASVDISTFPKGVYFISLNGKATKKIIKQ